jgi:hypothetical protein
MSAAQGTGRRLTLDESRSLEGLLVLSPCRWSRLWTTRCCIGRVTSMRGADPSLNSRSLVLLLSGHSCLLSTCTSARARHLLLLSPPFPFFLVMRVVIRPDYDQVSHWVASYVKARITNFAPTAERPFVLGLVHRACHHSSSVDLRYLLSHCLPALTCCPPIFFPLLCRSPPARLLSARTATWLSSSSVAN